MYDDARLNRQKHTIGLLATLLFHGLIAAWLLHVTWQADAPPVEMTVLYDPNDEPVRPAPPPAAVRVQEPVERRNPTPAETVRRGVAANPALPDQTPNDVAQKTDPGYASETGDVDRPLPDPPKATIDPRALFTAGNEYPEPAQTGTGTLNPGSRSGNADHGAIAAGTGNDMAYYLQNRKIAGAAPRPEHAENIPSREGVVVVVEIWVNEQGQVTRANAGVSNANHKTNTTNRNLWEAARRAALGTKFTPTTTPSQYGYIVYRFRWE
jgi:outer membrane biosynthesis protein TonB